MMLKWTNALNAVKEEVTINNLEHAQLMDLMIHQASKE